MFDQRQIKHDLFRSYDDWKNWELYFIENQHVSINDDISYQTLKTRGRFIYDLLVLAHRLSADLDLPLNILIYHATKLYYLSKWAIDIEFQKSVAAKKITDSAHNCFKLMSNRFIEERERQIDREAEFHELFIKAEYKMKIAKISEEKALIEYCKLSHDELYRKAELDYNTTFKNLCDMETYYLETKFNKESAENTSAWMRLLPMPKFYGSGINYNNPFEDYKKECEIYMRLCNDSRDMEQAIGNVKNIFDTSLKKYISRISSV